MELTTEYWVEVTVHRDTTKDTHRETKRFADLHAARDWIEERIGDSNYGED